MKIIERIKDYKQLIWILLIVMITLVSIDLLHVVFKGLFYKTIPFKIEDMIVVSIDKPETDSILLGKIILYLDSLDYRQYYDQLINDEDSDEISEDRGKINIQLGGSNIVSIDLENINFDTQKDSVTVRFKEKDSDLIREIKVEKTSAVNIQRLINSILNLILIIFVFSNSFLLLKYSHNPNSLLVVLFLILLFLPTPNNILPGSIASLWKLLISPFWGIIFYHFIVSETNLEKKVFKIYKISALLFLPGYLLSFLGVELGIAHIWSAFWLLKGFLLLRKQSRIIKDISLKRLLGSFSGIGISLLSAGIFFAIILLIALLAGVSGLAGLSDLLENKIIGIVIASLVVLPALSFLIGIIWFMGSFSWSLLAGTTLDMKIRSTIIYTIVGVVFITLFGILDYSLGEILQSIFGKFIASEFIAGIPATVGLIIFFNPMRNRVERLVDKKLNSTELDFLEKTDGFSRDLSEEGVQEGFEEYICDNLYSLLSLKKVALVSWSDKDKSYIFNEIRGSEIEENSPVKDEKDYLSQNLVRNITAFEKNPPEDISSFSLILPIIFDQQHKWFLALGGKEDRSSYTKSDEMALLKLADRIRLSLKFILAYEDIVNHRSEKIISKKNCELAEIRKKVLDLKKEIAELKS